MTCELYIRQRLEKTRLFLLTENRVFVFLFFVVERFVFVPSGPLFAELHRPSWKVRKAFLLGLGEEAWGRGEHVVPSRRPGPSLARTFTLARCAAAAPQVTKFRELRDFYGCPKVDPEVGISGPVRPTLILRGTL